MIKKSVFENDLVAGMQAELRKQASGQTPDLVKAGECLHAALEILEEAGLQRTADQVLEIMRKIAISNKTRPVQKMPSMQNLRQLGFTDEDMRLFGQGHTHSKMKLNHLLRTMGLSDLEIASFLGNHNLVPADEVSKYTKMLDMIKNPLKPLSKEVSEEVPEEISMESLPDSSEDVGELPSGDSIEFKSMAARRSGRPDKVSKRHIKSPTIRQEIKNYQRYGMPSLNADDGNWSDDFDSEIAAALGVSHPDQLSLDDLGDADVPQPESFEDDWKIWKSMHGELNDELDDEPPPTVRAIPKPPIEIIKIDDDLGDQDITNADDTLEVDLPEDFEDEISSHR